MDGFNYKKAIQVLNFFAHKEGGEINKMKAIKLIWLSDRAHLMKYGRPITNDRYYAMRFGPVPSNTKDLCECDNAFLDDHERAERDQYIKPNHGNLFYKTLKTIDNQFLSETDLEILNEIFKVFGKYDEFQLAEKVSHSYPEWRKHEDTIKKGTRTRVEMDYGDFFQDVDDDYFKSFDPEIVEVSKAMYKEKTMLFN